MTIDRAVLLVGSAKPPGTSSSEAIGRYLLAALKRRGVATTTTFVGRSPGSRTEQQLVHAVNDADLFVLSTPLYVDSLPYLVIRALEHIAQEPRDRHRGRTVATVINCGFPEADQCQTALDIVQAFARRSGFAFAGGLAVGEGGAIDGKRLEELGRTSRNLRKALDLSADELARGRPIPGTAIELCRRPLMPPRIYTLMGNLGWTWRATQNHVLSQLGARPFD